MHIGSGIMLAKATILIQRLLTIIHYCIGIKKENHSYISENQSFTENFKIYTYNISGWNKISNSKAWYEKPFWSGGFSASVLDP